MQAIVARSPLRRALADLYQREVCGVALEILWAGTDKVSGIKLQPAPSPPPSFAINLARAMCVVVMSQQRRFLQFFPIAASIDL